MNSKCETKFKKKTKFEGKSKLTTNLHLEEILKADSSAFCNASTNFQFFLRNSYLML